MPFFRAHGHESVSFREPWNQGEEFNIIKEYVHLRHSLMPYMYNISTSLFIDIPKHT
jgi:alpha-glucosidase (family GH31 glycosyl hydrolase)